MADMTTHKPYIPLAEALKAMPLETPAATSWQTVMAALPSASGIPKEKIEKKEQTTWPRYAMACGLSMLLFTAIFFNAKQQTTNSAVEPDIQLENLMQQSAQLENLLLSTRSNISTDANTENWQIELDQQLQHIDQRLSQNLENGKEQADLWQARIDVLRDANLLSVKQHLHAAEGNSLQVAFVETY
jgi:hypothetical protein